ncbi:MAG TPA: helix-turn-helix domain-containing protein [bacterium]|nr:helix-turn-helix domain-containing protein [bacterium]
MILIEPETPETLLLKKELNTYFLNWFANIKQKHKNIIILYFANVKIKYIALKLNISRQGVYDILKRYFVQFRKNLKIIEKKT